MALNYLDCEIASFTVMTISFVVKKLERYCLFSFVAAMGTLDLIR